MHKDPQLGAVMETCCDQCHSRFRVTEQQLKIALGKARCGECGHVFDALLSLKNTPWVSPPDYFQQAAEGVGLASESRSELSLHEAMYGSKRGVFASITPLLLLTGILLLLAFSVVQVVYYQRYQLIEKPQFQKQVSNLCELLPCDELQFSSLRQIKLLERNLFTHPVQPDALMVTGSFVNQAPFKQKLPGLLVSLFDLQGNLIANRLFSPVEYLLSNKNRSIMLPDNPIQFRLEIIDPGTSALTYEFEFI